MTFLETTKGIRADILFKDDFQLIGISLPNHQFENDRLFPAIYDGELFLYPIDDIKYIKIYEVKEEVPE